MNSEASEYAYEQQDFRISYTSFCMEPAASRLYWVVAVLPHRFRCVFVCASASARSPGLGHEHSDCWDIVHCTPEALRPCSACNNASQYARERRASLENVGDTYTSPVYPTLLRILCFHSICRPPTHLQWRGGRAFACLSTKTRNEGDTEKRDKIEQILWMDYVLPLLVRSITLNE